MGGGCAEKVSLPLPHNKTPTGQVASTVCEEFWSQSTICSKKRMGGQTIFLKEFIDRLHLSQGLSHPWRLKFYEPQLCQPRRKGNTDSPSPAHPQAHTRECSWLICNINPGIYGITLSPNSFCPHPSLSETPFIQRHQLLFSRL